MSGKDIVIVLAILVILGWALYTFGMFGTGPRWPMINTGKKYEPPPPPPVKPPPLPPPPPAKPPREQI